MNTIQEQIEGLHDIADEQVLPEHYQLHKTADSMKSMQAHIKDLEYCFENVATSYGKLQAENEQMEAAGNHLLKCGADKDNKIFAMQARIELLEKVYALVISRTHFCGGRDCTGFMSPDSATQWQCQPCRDMVEALTALEEQT